MSFAHLYAGRKEPTRPIFTEGSGLPSDKLLFIKPLPQSSKNNNLENMSLDNLEKQIQITKSNLRLPSLNDKGREKLENLLRKYEAEIRRRLSQQNVSIKIEFDIKEESIKDEPVEEAVRVVSPTVQPLTDHEPIFYVSDDLLSKMQFLSIDPHKNKLNVAKNTTIIKPTKPANSSSTSKSSSTLKQPSKTPEKSIKFLSLEESTKLVKEKKFIPKSFPRATVPDFSSDEGDEEDSEEDAYDHVNVSDDDS